MDAGPGGVAPAHEIVDKLIGNLAFLSGNGATKRLREYIIKGFAMDDERLKQAGGGNYFDELQALEQRPMVYEGLDRQAG